MTSAHRHHYAVVSFGTLVLETWHQFDLITLGLCNTFAKNRMLNESCCLSGFPNRAYTPLFYQCMWLHDNLLHELSVNRVELKLQELDLTVFLENFICLNFSL